MSDQKEAADTVSELMKEFNNLMDTMELFVETTDKRLGRVEKALIALNARITGEKSLQ